MTLLHEAEVRTRFDLLQRRFKRVVEPDDFRLAALRDCLEEIALRSAGFDPNPGGEGLNARNTQKKTSLPLEGLRVLDLGCGKGRFARRLAEDGAAVVGLDLSAAMLAEGEGLDRVRASARRLPFADGAFDAVVAVEVFEHLAALDDVLREARRVLRPGGVLAIVDKNAGSLNDRRPWLPNLLGKWLDEKRGRWMYPSGGPVRERWFWPGRLAHRLRREFVEVRVEFLLSPTEARRWMFRRVPRTRLFLLWSARVPQGRSA